MKPPRLLAILLAGFGMLAGMLVATPAYAASLEPVSSFGSNPGGLTMHAYVPDGLPDDAPVVIALHGCTQDAAGYHAGSGWQKYADAWGIALIYPQQAAVNNLNRCFNWFEPGDQARDRGEPASIMQMLDYAVDNYGVNPSRAYVTGLSAGGAMSAIMLATYPDRFAGGSIIGGIPYKCATQMIGAFSCMNPGQDRTPQAWGDLVRAAHPHTGERPKVAIWHGDADYTVAYNNSRESMEQWTNVAGIAGTPSETVNLPAGTTLEKFGSDEVRRYTVSGMGHGVPVAPGSAEDQCGTGGAYFLDTICSSYHDAIHFGLDRTAQPRP